MGGYADNLEETATCLWMSTLATDGVLGISFYLHGRRDEETVHLLEGGIEFCNLLEEYAEYKREGRLSAFFVRVNSKPAFAILSELANDPYLFNLVKKRNLLLEFIKLIKLEENLVLLPETKKEAKKIIQKFRKKIGLDEEKLRQTQKLFLDASAPFLAESSSRLSVRWP